MPSELPFRDDSVGPKCGQDFCRLGCVCDSVKQLNTHPDHCRQPECMFTCGCLRRKILQMLNQTRSDYCRVFIYCCSEGQSNRILLKHFHIVSHHNHKLLTCFNVSGMHKHKLVQNWEVEEGSIVFIISDVARVSDVNRMPDRV